MTSFPLLADVPRVAFGTKLAVVAPRSFTDLEPYWVPIAVVLLAALGALLWQRRLLRLLSQKTEAMRQSEQRLMLVLEGGDHGFWDWDLRSAIVVHRRTTSLLGYEEHEIRPTLAGWFDLIHPDDLPSVRAAVDPAALARTDSFVVQYRMKAKDGQWRWIVTRGKVLDRDPKGRPRRAVGTHTDVSAQKRMEEERVAFQQKVLEAQKLESLGLLAGGIAHDFNNLLTVVLGQASFVRDLKDPAAVENAVQQIEAAARKASDLCRQMLVYAGGGKFTMEQVDLNALVSNVAPLLRHSVRKDARLEFDLAGDLPPIDADPTQLRQILMNLVINASEALPRDGGTIRLVTARRGPTHAELRQAVYAPDLPRGGQVCLSIVDTGVGMTTAVRAKIFEPFFTTKFTGRGLGLAAVLGIVRAHRGTFCVHSEPGSGSSFTLFLPESARRPTTTVEPVAGADVHPAGPRATILVADDEPAVLAMSVAVLKHHGYEVVPAATGREAVERFTTTPDRFGAVILDFTMPELNGVGALMEIRRHRPNLPAVLMSGFGAAHAFERIPAENPPLFLQKPFAQHELLARVAEAVALGASGKRLN